jgi:branched-chain amino acid transport system permease protein
MLRLALTYLVALGPALVLLAGLILVIEMTYHLSVKASEGTVTSVFHVALDAASVIPWVAAAILTFGGFWLFRLTWPVVGAAWHEAFAQAHGTGIAK